MPDLKKIESKTESTPNLQRSKQQPTERNKMPNYYNHADYVALKDMRGWNKDNKAEQIEINWWIRLEYYATHRDAVAMHLNKFTTMVEKWLDGCGAHIPKMQVDRIARLAIGMRNRGGWGEGSSVPNIIKNYQDRENLHETVLNFYREQGELNTARRAHQ
jgi:hypothetical protein